MSGLHRREKKTGEVPHIPFYKDERVIGKKVTVSVSLRAFIIAVVVFVLAFGWALFKVIDDDAQLHNYLHHAHAERIADQNRTQAQINQLACYIIANIPDNEAPIVPKVRKQYDCPPYGKDPNFKLYKHDKKTGSKSEPTGGGASSGKTTSHPGSGGSAVAGPTHRSGSGGTGSSGGSGGNHGTPTPSPSPTPQGPVVQVPIQLSPVITSGPVGVGGTCAVRIGNTCIVDG